MTPKHCESYTIVRGRITKHDSPHLRNTLCTNGSRG
jgi:hypothetical protein